MTRLHAIALALLCACGRAEEPTWTFGPRTTPPGEVVTAGRQGLEAPEVPGGALAALVRGNNDAALALFRAAAPGQGSFVISPHSLAVALAMAYEGARGETERQMAAALRFTLPRPDLGAAFVALDRALAASGRGLSLRIVNALFGRAGFAFEPAFVEAVGGSYAAPISRVDFADPEGVRRAINDWVGRETEGLVPALMPSGTIDERTVLVLTNAIAFQAPWEKRFPPENTRPAPFQRLDGQSTMVDMMGATGSFSFTIGADHWAVDLAYEGGRLAMLIVLPNAGSFERFQRLVNAEQLERMTAVLGVEPLHVSIPRFTVRTASRPERALQALGMVDAFGPSADFSGIGGVPGELFVQAVVHEALVQVDERGTKAAAATGVSVARKKTDPQFRADRPFLFFIRDRGTGALLFMGRFDG